MSLIISFLIKIWCRLFGKSKNKVSTDTEISKIPYHLHQDSSYKHRLRPGLKDYNQFAPIHLSPEFHPRRKKLKYYQKSKS